MNPVKESFAQLFEGEWNKEHSLGTVVRWRSQETYLGNVFAKYCLKKIWKNLLTWPINDKLSSPIDLIMEQIRGTS